jgi:hypothetical protein
MKKAGAFYQIWDDGSSPIVFTSITKENGLNKTEFIKDLLFHCKSISSNFGTSYIVFNCSEIDLSKESLDFIKSIKAELAKNYIGAISFIRFDKMKFELNLEWREIGRTKMKFFKSFNEGLEFINSEMSHASELRCSVALS